MSQSITHWANLFSCWVNFYQMALGMASYVIWSCCWAYWRSMKTMFLLPTPQSPMNETRVIQRQDQPTLRCSCYWAYWRSMTTMFLLQTSQSPMDEARIVMCRDQPTIRCSYFSRRMGPVDATKFKRLDQPPERVVDLHRVRCSCFRRLVAEPSVVEV